MKRNILWCGILVVGFSFLPWFTPQAGVGPEGNPQIRSLSLTILPISMQVPQSGGMVIFDFSVTSTGQADTADIWFDLGLPDGQVIGPYYIWWDYMLQAGQTATKHCYLYISPMCMPNEYTILARAGCHCPLQIDAADTTNFSKASSSPPGAPPMAPVIAPTRMGDVPNEGTLIVTDGSLPTLSLRSASPQPCNPEVRIGYSVAVAGDVRVNLYNVNGQRVYQHVVRADAPGDQNLTIATGQLASGVYILSLEQGGLMIQRPLTVLK